jgi:hypothetical protein
MIFALTSDSVDHSQRLGACPTQIAYLTDIWNRTRFLYILAAIPHTNRLIAPRIAAALMRHSIFSPFWVAISVNCTCLLLIKFKLQPAKRPGNREYTLVEELESDLRSRWEPTSTATGLEETPLVTSTLNQARILDHTGISRARSYFHDQISQAAVLFRNPASKFCLTAFFMKRVAFASEGFMFQYASEKFLWQLQQTTWLRIAQASGAISATLIICPFLALLLSKRGTAPHVVDLTVIRSALIVLTFSFFLSWNAFSGWLMVFCMVSLIPLCETRLIKKESNDRLWLRRRPRAGSSRASDISYRLE